MEKIVFYVGDETGVVVEDKNFSESLFCEQYKSALKLFQKISNSSNDFSNIIAFCGDRGEGKTSCMKSFMQLLKNNDEIKKIDGSVSIHSSKLEILDVIDPAFFDKKHNLIELILGQMYGRLAKDIVKDEAYSSESNKRRELLKCFDRTKRCLAHLEKEKKDLYDPLEELGALSAGINLNDCISELFKEYLKYFDKERIVFAIDDLDLNMTEGYVMAEQIRKYLNHESCVLLISLKIEQMTEVVKNSILKECVEDTGILEDRTRVMAVKYVTKLIPYGHRILMPIVRDLSNVKLQICNHGDTLKNADELNTVKEVVTHLIFRKTRFLFYNEKGSTSPIVPLNLRSLRLLIGMLYQMDDFVDNTKHLFNKQTFKSYFFNEWTFRLAFKDRSFVEELLNYPDISGINKYVLMHFRSIEELNNATRFILFENDFENFSEYDISVGLILELLDKVERLSTDENKKMLLFFLRSFYSMKLYELYDEISEKAGGLYPIISDEDKEIVRVNTLFKNMNQLQRFLNGSYFHYPQNTFLAPQKNGNPRDLHAIAGKVLIELMKEVGADFEKFKSVSYEMDDESDEAKEWRAFKNKFRRCEFFIISTTQSLTYRNQDNDKSYNKTINSSIPPYMTEYNSNMGYFLYDVMAPFYNVVNLQYAYKRFADIVDFYDYALSHEWSLLRQMMLSACKERGKEEVAIGNSFDSTKAMHCLISDAVIRNVDVHRVIVETMHSNRFRIKETGSTRLLLEKTYDILTKLGMKTYSYTEGKAHEIHFAFLRAIISFIKEDTDDGFNSIFYVPNVDDMDKRTISDEDRNWLDDTFSFLRVGPSYPNKGKTLINKIRKENPKQIATNLPKGFLQIIFDNDQEYSSWDFVRNALALAINDLKNAAREENEGNEGNEGNEDNQNPQ